MSSPRYREIAPGPRLAPWVECYWSIRGEASEPRPNRVLPDGCADLIVGIAGLPGPAVVGTMPAAAVVPVQGTVDLFGIRFRPGGAAALLGLPVGELAGRRVPLDDLQPGLSARASALLEPADLPARADRAERLLLPLANRTPAADAELVRRAVLLLRRARGGVGVRETAAALGIGERRLQRAFDHAVGLSPRGLRRVLRFRRAVRAIGRVRGGSPVNWAALAAETGYADQPHLIREFRALAGLTPAGWAAEQRSVGFVQYEGDAAR